MRTLRIFISSPKDVAEERQRARAVIERVGQAFAREARLVPVLWEEAPLRATSSFQEGIDEQVDLGRIDLVVFILWSRLGTPLGGLYRSEGRDPTGTEWEFEQALSAHRERLTPDLLVYRRISEPKLPSIKNDPRGFEEATAQWKAVEGFFRRWFRREDGSFSAAFAGYGSPEGFEQNFERHLRALVAQRLARADDGGPSWKGAPFRGLLAFDVEHAPIFFGRARATFEALRVLQEQAARGRGFLLILGASGAGKSSLARAGLLAKLTRPDQVEPEAGTGFVIPALFTPGQGSTPFESLVAALDHERAFGPRPGGAGGRGDLVQAFRESPAAAVALVRERLAARAEREQSAQRLERPPIGRLALLVDQLEELFTRSSAPEERQAFARTLAALAQSGVVWVVATLRNDFYGRLAEVPELLALKGEVGQYDLLPPEAADVAEMVRLPAERSGLSFERREASGVALDDELISAALRAPGALPLLQFTLAALYEAREGTHLTWRAYEALGGLEGALTRRAEQTFVALDREAQSALSRLVRSLVEVSAHDESAVARRWPLRADLERDPAAGRLAAALLEARLLEADKDLAGRPVLGVAHEALLSAWGRFAGSIAADREVLNVRRRVQAQAAFWESRQRDASALLVEGAPLQDGQRLLAAGFLDLDASTVAYVKASQAAARRSKRLKIGALAAMLLGALGAWAWITHSQERRREDEARTHAGEARRTAKAKDQEVRRLRAEREALAQQVETARATVFAVFAPVEKRAEFQAKERQLAALSAALTRTIGEAREALEAAARYEAPLGGTTVETRAAFGVHFMERWREALASGDELAAGLAREQVERVAREHHADELEGLSTLTVEVDPPDAEVYLFRYEPYESVRTDRPVLSRLVPVPTSGVGRLRPTEWVPGFCPGDRCLAVNAVEPGSPAAGVLEPGDLVIRLNDMECGDGLFVTELAPEGPAAKAGAKAFDRIESLDGNRAEVAADWTQVGVAEKAGGPPYKVSLGRAGVSLEVEGPHDKEAGEATGIQAWAEAGRLLAKVPAPEGGYRLLCLRRGEVHMLEVSAGKTCGLTLERTAYPLVLGRELGHRLASPTSVRDCAPGSYLLYVRAPGWEDQRFPVVVPRASVHAARVRVRLLAAGTSPEGFAYVPPGVFLYGGDPEAVRSASGEVIDTYAYPELTGGFWIARHEVTWAEWLEFLNDPETQAGLVAGRNEFLPRHSDHLFVRRGDDRRYEQTIGTPETAVLGVSWNDMRSPRGFLAWRNRSKEKAVRSWSYDLPSEIEWERAARGADGRVFPWGGAFDFALCSSSYVRPYQAHALPPASVPEDESPFSVSDLAGGRSEWCRDEFRTGSGTYVMRGASWGRPDPKDFRTATRLDDYPSGVGAECGARLVARPRP